MRLLNVHTLEFGEFYDEQVPPYAILSHRWGSEEISYKDYKNGRNRESSGYRKVVEFCRVVREKCRREFQCDWAWIDTCCIDKRSSAELSEAINSMFEWYKRGAYCWVYLEDVGQPQTSERTLRDSFMDSAWFTRGWTLQELLAPIRLIFSDRTWHVLGHKCRDMGCVCRDESWPLYGPNLNKKISSITGIDVMYLEDLRHASAASVACKMSWAARRQTTRTEDQAYCLLGLFNVNMPLLYGEGKKAFMRLQHEIIRTSNDESIFAWDDCIDGCEGEATWPLWAGSGGILAQSAAQFVGSGDVVPWDVKGRQQRPYSLTNTGLEIGVSPTYAVDNYTLSLSKFLWFNLNCSSSYSHGTPIQVGVALHAGKWHRLHSKLLARLAATRPEKVRKLAMGESVTLYVRP